MMLKTAFLLLMGTAASGWAGAVLSFDPTPVTVSTGNTFDLNVDLSTGQTPVASFAFDVVFPTFLQVLSNPIEEGYFAANGCCFSWNSIDNVNGVIGGISDVDFSGGGDTNTDTLVQIQFTAIAPGSGQITFQNPSLSDPSGNPITIDLVSAANVTSNATPEPAPWAMTGLGVAAIAWNLRRLATSDQREPRAAARS